MDRKQRRQHRRQRFIALIDEVFGGNQARFEARTGIAASLASRYISDAKGIGEDMKDKIEKLAEVPGWFDEEPTGHHSLDAGLSIDVLDVAASMGMGELRADTENVIHRLSIGLEWVRENLRGISSTANLRVISGRGTSMEPTYSDGAILVVDIGDKSPRDNQVYVLSAGERVFVKRVHQRVDGRFDITSDNPTAKGVETLNGDHQVTVHGRVVWAWDGKRL